MKMSAEIFRKETPFLSIAEAIGLMIAFGSFTATIIFGILSTVKNDKKKK